MFFDESWHKINVLLKAIPNTIPVPKNRKIILILYSQPIRLQPISIGIIYSFNNFSVYRQTNIDFYNQKAFFVCSKQQPENWWQYKINGQRNQLQFLYLIYHTIQYKATSFMNLQRLPSSGSLRTPILKPNLSINQQVGAQSSDMDEKLATLQKNCSKDYTLKSIVFNSELMSLIKK